ncbi:ABATE domain-containing protein [Streptomyces sp. NPDC057580]|uniref:ABATE domain-containing protein n=1 Tax=Streptomyces sp. NPDC057580 TaxID=3346173 RepID=UPI0036BFA6F5
MTSFQRRVMETVPSGDLRESARGAPGPVLHTPQGRPYRFDPGVLCLKLLPTGGHSGYARYEVLHTPADPVRWAGQSPLVPAPELAVSAGELARAYELRSVPRRLTTAQERAEVLDGGARGGSARWTGWPPRRAEPGRGESSPAWLIGMLPGWTSAGRFPDPRSQVCAAGMALEAVPGAGRAESGRMHHLRGVGACGGCGCADDGGDGHGGGRHAHERAGVSLEVPGSGHRC